MTPQLFGFIGILGAILMGIGDLLLLAAPASAAEYYGRDQGRGSMREIGRRRLYAGSALGVLTAPLQLAGVWLIFLGLRPAGPGYALPVTLLFAYTVILAVGVHSIFALMGDILQAQDEVSKQSRPVLQALDQRTVRYWLFLFSMAALPIVLGSAWFAYAVFSQATAWPAWVAIANPALVIAALLPISLILPAPLAGYLSPAYYNWMWLIFFTVITLTYS